MPYQIENPLSAGMAAAGSFLQAKSEGDWAKKEYLRQQRLDAQAAADAAARQKYEEENLGFEKQKYGTEQGELARVRGVEAGIPPAYSVTAKDGPQQRANKYFATADYLAKNGDIEGAQKYILLGQGEASAYEHIQKGTESPSVIAKNYATAHLDEARANFERNRLKLEYDKLSSHERVQADALAGRLQVAGMNDDARKAIAAATIINQRTMHDETLAQNAAIAQYKAEYSAYMQQAQQYNLAHTMNPNAPQGAAPQAPQQSSPGITFNPTINLGTLGQGNASTNLGGSNSGHGGDSHNVNTPVNPAPVPGSKGWTSADVRKLRSIPRAQWDAAIAATPRIKDKAGLIQAASAPPGGGFGTL